MATHHTAPVEEHARDAGLRYVTDDTPGITRRRRGKGFSYHAPDGSLIRDDQVLARCKSLAVPPAWTDVWICPDPNGHIQATGRDARGRKQYRYHDDWRRHRDEVKYERLAEFGEELTRIRERVGRDLRRDGLPREKVLAAVVRLLDRTLARVGNDEYAKENDSFGLTTLRDRHADIKGSRLRLHFEGKAGREIDLALDDERLARIVQKCRAIPGYDLFQYDDDDGERRRVTSDDVNEYLREVTGDGFTAKDFRTWGATVLAIEFLCEGLEPDVDPKAQAKEAVEYVAEQLGNTPAVCKASYVHPGVFEEHVGLPLDRVPPSKAKRFRGLSITERRLMTVLRRLGEKVEGKEGASKTAAA